jgi:predicted dehydrogenase
LKRNFDKCNNMANKMKMGIIGFGLFGENMLIPGYKEAKNAEIVAITKRSEEEAKEKAKKFGIPYGYAYADKQKMLENKEIEAIYVAGPNHLHMIDTIDALNAGKDVIVEKPMAMNAAECEKMIEAAKKNDRKLMIAHCLRYNTTINYIKNFISKPEFGSIVLGTCDFLSNAFKSKRTWKFKKDIAGGGAAFDLGVHVIDTLRYLVNSELIGYTCEHRPERSPDEVDLVASFTLNFKNNIIGRATSTYIGPRHTYIEIYGEHGYIKAFDWNKVNTETTVEYELNGEIRSKKINNREQYAEMIDDFVHYVRSDKNIDSPISGMDGLINQRIIDMVNL